MDWLVDWLVDWLIDGLIGWLIDWFDNGCMDLLLDWFEIGLHCINANTGLPTKDETLMTTKNSSDMNYIDWILILKTAHGSLSLELMLNYLL